MSSSNLPSPISPVKWKEYSLSHHTNPSPIPRSRESLTPKPGHLSSNKKEMIEDLRIREQNRAARFKLRSTLIQELTGKLGPKYKKYIPHHVDNLLSRKKNITQDDVIELEQIIRGSSNGNGGRDGSGEGSLTARPSSTTKLPSTNLDLSRIQNSQNSTQPSVATNDEAKSNPLTPLPTGTEWEQLTLYQTLEYDRITKEKELKKLEAKRLLALQLSEQVEEGRARRERERAEDKAYADSIINDAKQYNKEQEFMLRQKHHENSLKLQDFKEQIALVRQKKNQNKELTAIETKQELERIQAGLNYEQQLLQQKKEKEKQIHSQTVQENEENNRQKILRKQREQEEEFKRNELYERRLQADEQRKQEAFQKRLNKIEKNIQIINQREKTAEGGGAADQEKECVRGQFSWDVGNENTKQQLRYEKLQKIKNENNLIMKQKKQLEYEEKLKDNEAGTLLKEQTMEFYERERVRKREEAEKKRQYGQLLQHQIENNQQHLKSAMTKPEKSVNLKELKMIQSDANLHSRIAHRLRLQTPGNGSGTAREMSTLALTRPF